MVKNRHASATIVAVDLGYIVCLRHLATSPTSPLRSPISNRGPNTIEVGWHSTRLRVAEASVAGQFHRQLDLHLNSSSSSSQLTNKHNLNLNPPIQDKHFHRLTHQTYYICITRICICTSRQYTQTLTSTTSHHIAHHGYRYASLPTALSISLQTPS